MGRRERSRTFTVLARGTLGLLPRPDEQASEDAGQFTAQPFTLRTANPVDVSGVSTNLAAVSVLIIAPYGVIGWCFRPVFDGVVERWPG